MYFEMIVTGQGAYLLQGGDVIASKQDEQTASDFYMEWLHNIYAGRDVVVLDDPRAGELEKVA